jgi:uncharacterized protein with HEPN domain
MTYKNEILKSEIEVCDIHSKRMRIAYENMKSFFPFNSNTIKNLNSENIAYLDMFLNRFAKLQDTIGQKLFPLILDLLGENIVNKSFIDNLNRLEKLGVIESAEDWKEFRQIRNEIAHDYPNQPEIVSMKLNHCFEKSEKLLDYWSNLKNWTKKF